MENTTENVISAIKSRGYMAAEKHHHCTECDELLNADAIAHGLMGCMVMGTNCLTKYYKKPITEVIAQKIAYDKLVANGDLVCDVCGCRGARPCPGEGQNLCETHNTRRGINRWS